MQKLPEAHEWGDAYAGKRKRFAPTSALPLILDGPFFPSAVIKQLASTPKSLTWRNTVFPQIAVLVTSNPRLKTPNREHIYLKTTNTFQHFVWKTQSFHLDLGIISSPSEWLLNPEIKSKYKRYLGLLSSFFL